MAFLRLIVFGYLFLTGIYILISIYSRSVRTEKLEKRFARENPDASEAERDAYVDEGLAAYRGSLRRRLILLVYVVPTVAVAVILYITNAN